MYRIICQYLPDAQTMAVARRLGAWRVVVCVPTSVPSMALSLPVRVVQGMLVLSSATPRQRNSWCSPRKILAQWQAHQRKERERQLEFAALMEAA